MAYVIAKTCIDCKDAACVSCCPVDCIYEGPRTFYIHPDECINCGICVSVCPPEAIWEDADLPAPLQRFIAINREFFLPERTRGNQSANRRQAPHCRFTPTIVTAPRVPQTQP